MPLHVDYAMKNRIGYYRQEKTNRKIWLCSANALWAEINFYVEHRYNQHPQMAQLCGFIANVEHLKRCLTSGILHYKGLTFFSSKMDADMWKAVKALTENGIKVTIK